MHSRTSRVTHGISLMAWLGGGRDTGPGVDIKSLKRNKAHAVGGGRRLDRPSVGPARGGDRVERRFWVERPELEASRHRSAVALRRHGATQAVELEADILTPRRLSSLPGEDAFWADETSRLTLFNNSLTCFGNRTSPFGVSSCSLSPRRAGGCGGRRVAGRGVSGCGLWAVAALWARAEGVLGDSH